MAYIMPSITLMGDFLVKKRHLDPTEELYTGWWMHGYDSQRLFKLCKKRMKWEQKSND